MFKNMTTVTQGSVGLGVAIAWFVEKGNTVCLPLIDNQPYDLVIDRGDGLKRVQVKTTQYKKKGSDHYAVQLKSVRANKTQNKIKKFDGSSCDLVYVVTKDKTKYLIPSKELDGRDSLVLGPSANKWLCE